MFNFKNTEREVHNLKLKNLELEKDRELSSEIFHHAEIEGDRNELKLNQIDLTTGDLARNQPDREAVEFKAKALFELEQVIIEIEQFKQICQ